MTKLTNLIKFLEWYKKLEWSQQIEVNYMLEYLANADDSGAIDSINKIFKD